jgi:hypothetical protein
MPVALITFGAVYEGGEMADNEAPTSPSDRFPALKPLEESVERAKLRQALAEADAAALKAKLPSLDVDIAQDAVVISDKTTGLARVLVQLDSDTLADDIADRALDAARAATSADHKYVFHVISDLAVLKQIDALRLLKAQLRLLSQRLDSLAPAPEKRKPGADKKTIAPLAAAPLLLGAGIQGIGLISKLIAHEYTLSGSQVAVDDLGFDLEIAHALAKKDKAHKDENVRVTVDRLLPTPATSEILQEIEQLANDANKRLSPMVAAAAVELEKVAVEVDETNAEIDSIDKQIVEFAKNISGSLQPVESKKSGTSKGTDASPEAGTTSPALEELRRLNADRANLRARLPALRENLAGKRDAHDRASGLLTDISAFITSTLTLSSASSSPVIQAARAEALTRSDDGAHHFVLYARLIAGGIDQEIEKKLGPDPYVTIAGASAEFALLSGDGMTLVASKTLSLMEASKMNLGDPDSFHRFLLDYMDFHRAPVENGHGDS